MIDKKTQDLSAMICDKRKRKSLIPREALVRAVASSCAEHAAIVLNHEIHTILPMQSLAKIGYCMNNRDRKMMKAKIPGCDVQFVVLLMLFDNLAMNIKRYIYI